MAAGSIQPSPCFFLSPPGPPGGFPGPSGEPGPIRMPVVPPAFIDAGCCGCIGGPNDEGTFGLVPPKRPPPLLVGQERPPGTWGPPLAFGRPRKPPTAFR